MIMNDRYSAEQLFGLDVRGDIEVSAMQHAMIDAASGAIGGGGVPPKIVAALCDLVAGMSVHQFDINDLAARKEIADACSRRILRTMQTIAENLKAAGVDQIGEFCEMPANKAH